MFILRIFLDFSFLGRTTTLPSLKLIALDLSELHNNKEEMEVFSVRGGLEGAKKPVWSDLEAEKLVELLSVQTFRREKKLTSG